jgi:hypothetical protein
MSVTTVCAQLLSAPVDRNGNVPRVIALTIPSRDRARGPFVIGAVPTHQHHVMDEADEVHAYLCAVLPYSWELGELCELNVTRAELDRWRDIGIAHDVRLPVRVDWHTGGTVRHFADRRSAQRWIKRAGDPTLYAIAER